jgi:hypothetical protein
MRRRVWTTLFAVTPFLWACGSGDEGNGGLTAEQSRQLNEAAEMLDAAPWWNEEEPAVPDAEPVPAESAAESRDSDR